MLIDTKINEVLWDYRDCNFKSGAVRKQATYELIKVVNEYLFQQEHMLTKDLQEKQNRINELEKK